MEKLKRKTYSIRGDLSQSLGTISLEMEALFNRSIPRQLILDMLIELIKDDKVVFNKVFSKIKNGLK